jgi:hypothetical protein
LFYLIVGALRGSGDHHAAAAQQQQLPPDVQRALGQRLGTSIIIIITVIEF